MIYVERMESTMDHDDSTAQDMIGYRPIGTAGGDRYLVFGHLWTWKIRVYDQIAGYELPAGDDHLCDQYPRFTIEGDHLIDQDMDDRHPIRFTGDQ